MVINKYIECVLQAWPGFQTWFCFSCPFHRLLGKTQARKTQHFLFFFITLTPCVCFAVELVLYFVIYLDKFFFYFPPTLLYYNFLKIILSTVDSMMHLFLKKVSIFPDKKFGTKHI